MGLGVKQVQYGSEICREWAACIMKNPLKRGVTRVVTVAKDDMTKTIGRDSEVAFVEVKKPDGFHKIIIRDLKDNYTVKSIQYPDGSWSETTYNRSVYPHRTNGEFVMLKKDGSSVKIGYGADGYVKPEEMKEHFKGTLKSLGNPNAEVDLRDAFESRVKSKAVKFFNGISFKIGRFFERFNKTNRTLRKLAREFEAKA